MTKKLLSIFALTMLLGMPASAQNIKIKGVLENNRYDDGENLKSQWIGSLYDEKGNYMNVTAFIADLGIYAMSWNGTALETPSKDPAVNMSDIKQGTTVDYEKAIWANNFNLMSGNSGAVYVGGKIVTVMSRDYQSTPDEELFAVRKWDAKTGNLLSAKNDYMNVSANIESAGMSYNPKDGKVYGFFHITDAKLMDEIINDENYYTDEDDADFGREGLDDGYCLGTIDLKTMKITPITPGLYYGNYVAFAINSEGRAFVLTSGGMNGYVGQDGKIYDIDNKLAGAQLIEIDTNTGLLVRNSRQVTDDTTNETYTEYTYPYPATGYCSQARRQAACFAKSDPNKLYWIGYYNSGKGVNDHGSWSSLSDREWKTNGKYDTALYEINLLTGVCTRLAKVPNRCSFSCIWIDGDDCSDGVDMDISGIQEVKQAIQNGNAQVYNLNGQLVQKQSRGLNIVKQGDKVTKVMMR